MKVMQRLIETCISKEGFDVFFRFLLIFFWFLKRDDDKRLVGLPEGVGIIPANTRLQIGISTNIENTSNVSLNRVIGILK